MSERVREEDRQKNSCPSRGLGIAAAAIGVGVGAALYYFFNKRQENPSAEGSSSEWTCEQQQTFRTSESDDSYTTISEHDTSDTSMNTSEESSFFISQETDYTENSTSEDTFMDEDIESTESDSDTELEIAVAMSLDIISSDASDSETEISEWDITTNASAVPNDMHWFRLFGNGIANSIRRNIIGSNMRTTKDEINAIKRQEAFRERSWTLEECSICFDVMLRNQEVTALPCAHNFHTECIMPWLQEKQTCPNCRKVAE